MKNVASVSVNKGYCSHQAAGLRVCVDGRGRGCPWLCTLKEFRMEKSRILTLVVKVHIKGMISMSQEPCIFPYTENLQFSSVAQSCLTLWDPMNCSTPGLPVYHQLPEFTQTHVHWVGDAIQPSHPLPSPSPPALNLSQHQGIFKWVSSLHQVAKYWISASSKSFQWTPRTDLLQNGLVGPPCSPRDSQESSPTPQFKSINSSVLSFLHSLTLTFIHDQWKNHSPD